MARDRQILDAAAALFYEKGFHGVGVDEIGERVGISGPALYRHFRNKDEILATLFNEALDELISATAAVFDDPQRDLERLIRHHVEFSISNRHLVNVYQREDRSLVEPWRRHFERRMRQYATRWEATLQRCFPDASAVHISAATQAAHRPDPLGRVLADQGRARRGRHAGLPVPARHRGAVDAQRAGGDQDRWPFQ